MMQCSIEANCSPYQFDFSLPNSLFVDDVTSWVGDYWENIDDKRDATRTEETDQPVSPAK